MFEHLEKYPLLLLAGLFIGMSAALTLRIHLRLRTVGDNSYQLFTVPTGFLAIRISRAYLNARRNYGWSPWPAYGIWLFLLGGVRLAIVGVARM
jgi:hypothetical protein